LIKLRKRTRRRLRFQGSRGAEEFKALKYRKNPELLHCFDPGSNIHYGVP